MTDLRVGQGFDVHPFSDDPARALVLGGIPIPDSPGLVGHSDADVLAHALADALLGAAGLGDIGTHFPASEPEWAGADSLDLLARSLALAAAAGLVPVNADCTVVCQAPRLAPFVGAMADRLGAVLGVPVSVKAKSAEGLGSLGRVEGIACLAVALLTGTGSPT